MSSPDDPSPGGRVWVLPADVTTDALAPGRYMSLGLDGIAGHCLEAVLPDFAAQVRPGDLLAAGPNFGTGSSREQAAGVLRHLGIAAVLAPSFAGLFYRNAINLGLTVLVCPRAGEFIDGEHARLQRDPALVQRGEGRAPIAYEPAAPFLQRMLDAGGLLPLLERRLLRGEIAAQQRPAS
ncbi:MAG: 3-isopropylmalate dehydratase [Burkholderiaceae bacterium]